MPTHLRAKTNNTVVNGHRNIANDRLLRFDIANELLAQLFGMAAIPKISNYSTIIISAACNIL
jgi:hypothetical protein